MIGTQGAKEGATPGSDGFALSGAISADWQAFGDILSDSVMTRYAALNATDGVWEVGVASYDASANELVRDTVLHSSADDGAPSYPNDATVWGFSEADLATFHDNGADQAALEALDRTAAEQFKQRVLYRDSNGNPKVRWEYPEGTTVDGPYDADADQTATLEEAEHDAIDRWAGEEAKKLSWSAVDTVAELKKGVMKVLIASGTITVPEAEAIGWSAPDSATPNEFRI